MTSNDGAPRRAPLGYGSAVVLSPLRISPGIAAGLSRYETSPRFLADYYRLEPGDTSLAEAALTSGSLFGCVSLLEAVVLAECLRSPDRDVSVLFTPNDDAPCRYIVALNASAMNPGAGPSTRNPAEQTDSLIATSPATLEWVARFGYSAKSISMIDLPLLLLEQQEQSPNHASGGRNPHDYLQVDPSLTPPDDASFANGTMFESTSFIESVAVMALEQKLGFDATLAEASSHLLSSCGETEPRWFAISNREYSFSPAGRMAEWRATQKHVTGLFAVGDPAMTGHVPPTGKLPPDIDATQVREVCITEAVNWELARSKYGTLSSRHWKPALSPAQAACLTLRSTPWSPVSASTAWQLDPAALPIGDAGTFAGGTVHACRSTLDALVLSSFEEAHGFQTSIGERMNPLNGGAYLVCSSRPFP